MIHAIEQTRLLVNAVQMSCKTIYQETLVGYEVELGASHAWVDMWENLTLMSRNLTTLREELWDLKDILRD
ncbi:hypothetical protein OCU04_001049 [Sclerotinia nivalis]|uniref:Uncharacterized protein n=1 Tax=Sclerotinia nivalis TaxID=352851 RepID=A0A9X0B074_9HELO|nr:hypothetical protein OCU04_001049 [Sclerotinia nivalis]